MTGLEALETVQYATVKGKRLAVVDIDDWEALIEWLEMVEDLKIAQQAFAELKSVEGDRDKAGWLKWDELKEELE